MPRVLSIDAARGVAILIMVLVDNGGDYGFAILDHSPWKGITLADLAMPIFDFLVGVSIGLSLRGRSRGTKQVSFVLDGLEDPLSPPDTPEADADAAAKEWWASFNGVVSRAARLFVLGMLTQNGFFLKYDLSTTRTMGVLQRVAVCYLVAGVAELTLPGPNSYAAATADSPTARVTPRARTEFLQASLPLAGVALALCAAHTAILYAGPQWDGCAKGSLSPRCNAAAVVDSWLLGKRHMYFPANGGDFAEKGMTFQRLPACSKCAPALCAPPDDAPEWCGYDSLDGGVAFDPEGLVSSLTAVVAALVGLNVGAAYRQWHRHDPRVCRNYVLSLGAVQAVAGCVLHLLGARFNTDLYSVSYLLASTGAACLILGTLDSAMAGTLDGPPAVKPLIWLGSNSIGVYLLACTPILSTVLGMFYWKQRENSLNGLLFPGGGLWGEGPLFENPSAPYLPTNTELKYNTAALAWLLMLWIPALCVGAGYAFRRKAFFKV